MALLTTSDIQNYLPTLDLTAYSLATISGMINRAEARAAQFCSVKGFALATEVRERGPAIISNFGELRISVRRKPIVTVSGISLTKGSFSSNLVLTDQGGNALYQIPYPNATLVFPNSYFYLTGTFLAGGSSQLLTLRGAKVFYEITYTGGYDAGLPDDSAGGVPSDLKYALSLYFMDTIAQAANPNGVQSFTQGSFSQTFSQHKEGKSRLILEAEDALMNGNYVRPEIF